MTVALPEPPMPQAAGDSRDWRHVRAKGVHRICSPFSDVSHVSHVFRVTTIAVCPWPGSVLSPTRHPPRHHPESVSFGVNGARPAEPGT
jgi:hypothetical protein